MIGLFRSSSAIYTDVYDRLPNVFSSSAVEQVIDAVIRSNVLAIFSVS
jgi:hypothetical protein